MDAPADYSPPRPAHSAHVSSLMAVIFMLALLLLFTWGGIFYVLAHGRIVSFTLAPKTLSTTTPAAGDCPTFTAIAQRSAVPVRRGSTRPSWAFNQSAGACNKEGGGIDAESVAGHRRPRAAGRLQNLWSARA